MREKRKMEHRLEKAQPLYMRSEWVGTVPYGARRWNPESNYVGMKNIRACCCSTGEARAAPGTDKSAPYLRMDAEDLPEVFGEGGESRHGIYLKISPIRGQRTGMPSAVLQAASFWHGMHRS